jgi:peptide/nickel transport system permease protein
MQIIPSILVVVVFNFVLINLAPGDPAIALAGELATPQTLEMVRREWGLDKPLYERLLIYISNVLRGNLGRSMIYGLSVADLIWSRLPTTILLMGSSLLFSSIVGVMMGVVAARKPYSLLDNCVALLAVMAFSIPVFWLGQMLIVALALNLRIFPTGGIISLRETSSGIGYVIDVATHLFLPAISMGLIELALIVRLTRANMLEVLRSDFIVTAMCKGLSENTVFIKHALRNALLPVVTLIGVRFGHIFTGAIMVETVFSWPGVGTLMYEAIMSRDYGLVMGIFLLISAGIILSTLITDIAYSFIDPRIRYVKTEI